MLPSAGREGGDVDRIDEDVSAERRTRLIFGKDPLVFTAQPAEDDEALVGSWLAEHGVEGLQSACRALLRSNRAYVAANKELLKAELDRAAGAEQKSKDLAADILETTVGLITTDLADLSEGFGRELMRQAEEYRAGRVPTREGAGLPACEHTMLPRPANPVVGLTLTCPGCGQKVMVTEVSDARVRLVPVVDEAEPRREARVVDWAGGAPPMCDHSTLRMLSSPKADGLEVGQRTTCTCGVTFELMEVSGDLPPTLTWGPVVPTEDRPPVVAQAPAGHECVMPAEAKAELWDIYRCPACDAQWRLYPPGEPMASGTWREIQRGRADA
jgi:hypothetical protein